MNPYRIAVCTSGYGSNLQAIIDRVRDGRLDVSIELVVCDREQAYSITRAREAGIEVLLIEPRMYASREQYEQRIVDKLQEKHIDLVVLAGYMRIITAVLVHAYEGRIINVHPSLLPAFRGMHAVQQAYQYGVKVTGVTVHIVDEGLDSGPIIAQQCVEVIPGDSEASLTARIQTVEHELLPQVIGWFRSGCVQISGRNVIVQEV
jgi:phosphoribosylglycinamide formyltransferase-1